MYETQDMGHGTQVKRSKESGNGTWVTKGPELNKFVLPKDSNYIQHFPWAHQAHSLETWGSLLRTMNTCGIVAAMLDFFDVCCTALQLLLPNSFTLVGCVAWLKGP